MELKATIWRIHVGKIWDGRTASSAVVESAKGLTAFEAWQRAKLEGSPAFHQCTYIPIK